MKLEEKIKFLRKALRMSQEEFAKEIGKTQTIISAYELGQKRPSYKTLLLLIGMAKKYKIKVNLKTIEG